MTAAATPDAPTPPTGRLLAATLFCEICGSSTPHRLLRSTVRRDGSVRGIARCRECRTVHPFDAAVPRAVAVAVVVSDGRASSPDRRSLPAGTVLVRGERFPDAPSPWRIQRLDGADGRPRREAPAEEIATAWVVLDRGAVIPVSLVEGRRTRPLRFQAPVERVVGVGENLVIDGLPITIVALRAKGQTWRRLGDRFPAGEIARLYTRRTVSPPAGNNAWSRERGMSSSRASVTSASARPRSSPGPSRR